MHPSFRSNLPRLAGALWLVLLAACGPTPTPPPGTPAPVTATATAMATGTAMTAGTAPPTAAVATALTPATAPAAASPSPAGPRSLTVCLVGEPQSLYRYARPETNRDHLLAALYDGPID